MPFKGFKPAATRFFKELAENQNASWFAEHKAEHEEFVKAPLGALVQAVLVQAVTARLSGTRAAARGVSATPDARCGFRINRDVRFSADKSP